MSYYLPFYILISLIAYFDPQNGLGIRPYFLFALIPLWLYGARLILNNLEKNYLTLLLAYILPLWGLLVFWIRGRNSLPITDTSYISFAIVFSLIFMLKHEKSQQEFKKASVICGLIFSAAILYSAIELLILNESHLIDFAISHDMARISLKNYDDVAVPYVYYYSSTLLILPLSILLGKLSLPDKISHRGSLALNFSFYFMLVAFALSGTRSHILLSFILMLLYIKNSKGVYRLATGVIGILTIVFYLPSLIDIAGSMLSPKETRNFTKISMLGLYRIIFTEPLTVVIGQGFQAVSWSRELLAMVAVDEGGIATKTELTFIELFRVFGFPVAFLVVLGAIRESFKKMIPEHRYKRVALLLLAADSLFNPHLFSTYGSFIMALSLSESSLPVLSQKTIH